MEGNISFHIETIHNERVNSKSCFCLATRVGGIPVVTKVPVLIGNSPTKGI